MYSYKTRHHLPVLLLHCFLLVSVTPDDCPYKECECAGTYIQCQGLGLTAIPLYNGVQKAGFLTLNFDSNQITEVPGSLPTGLIEISFLDNPITTIDDNAFDELSSTLESLYFMNARFARIPEAFLHLNALQHLNIMNTKILDWNIGAMAHIGQTLQTLNLENVGLTTWPVWVQFFSRLNELNMAVGSVSSIPDNAFDKLTISLMTVTLNNNSFSSVPKALSKLKNVITLDLIGNKISNITWLPQSIRLTDIALDNNNISDANHLSSVLRSYADNLASVTLSSNQLTVIPDLSFLTKIASFDLSHNRISDPNSGSVPASIFELFLGFNLLPSIPAIFMRLKSLTYLQLPNNVIKELQGVDIPVWITDVDLEYNLITELTDTSFPNNSAIREILLNNNPLVTISNLAFKNIPSLIALNLKGTKLTRLPLSLIYLNNLIDLDMSNNPDLVCTCIEKSLEPSFTSRIEVVGNCGAISIHNFFATLSLTCP